MMVSREISKNIATVVLVCLSALLVSCHRNSPERVVKSFYYAYQNLDFDKAEEFCAPSMSHKISLIKSGFNAEKKSFLQAKVKKQRITVREVVYNDTGNQAVVKVFFTTPEDSVPQVDYVLLEKCGDEWKVSNF